MVGYLLVTKYHTVVVVGYLADRQGNLQYSCRSLLSHCKYGGMPCCYKAIYIYIYIYIYSYSITDFNFTTESPISSHCFNFTVVFNLTIFNLIITIILSLIYIAIVIRKILKSLGVHLLTFPHFPYCIKSPNICHRYIKLV